MEVKFAKFWFEDLLSLHVRAQGKKKKKQTKNKELQRFACLDDRELDDVVDGTFKQIRQIMQSNAE